MLLPERLARQVERRTANASNLYDESPARLDLAHEKLDEADFAANGWSSDLTDEQVLEKLLAPNLEQARVEHGEN